MGMPIWTMLMTQMELNQAMLEVDSAWIQEANTTLMPMWTMWMSQWEKNQAMLMEQWETNKDTGSLLWEKANATWWPIWSTLMTELESNKGEWEKITASWFEEMNSTWSPVWSTWMEQWDSQFLLWEETYGDEPWWPMWSAWMKEWKANMMTNNWWTMSANWSEWLSVPSATWWPSTTWSATNAAL